MRLIFWLIISSFISQKISGSPLHRRTERTGHVIHYHKSNSSGRHEKHLHMAHDEHSHHPNFAHNIHHEHRKGQGHRASQSHNSNSHAGHHSHKDPSSSIQGNPVTGSRIIYEVPKDRHFNEAARNRLHNHTSHLGTHHHHHGTDPALDLDFSSLMIEEDLFKSPVQAESKYTKKTPDKIETTTPSPDHWKMKNTVQVSDTRSFGTIFRQTVSNGKVPVKLKSVPSSTGSGAAPVNENQQNVIRYEDHGSKSIAKRGIGRLGDSQSIRSPGRFGNGFIENTLTIRVWNESRITKNINSGLTDSVDKKVATRTTQKFAPVTVSPRYTQGRLGRRIINQRTASANYATTSAPRKTPAATKMEYTVKTKMTTSKPNIKPTEMVQLQGIHVMFSQAQQKKNSSVPTIHLTAAIDGQQNKQHVGSHGRGSPLDSLQSVIEKIVGTAIIKDGHLYLIVYPFGESKSMDLRFSDNKTLKINTNIATSSTPNRTHLPTNKPVPIPGIGPHSGRLTSRKPTSTPSPPLTVLSTSPLPITTTVSFSSMEMNHAHHHHVHGMDGSMKTQGETSKAATEKDPLAPVPRFTSPWKTLNLSSIFPHPDNISLTEDDDKDVKVVPFVAQATDPFDKIKMILEALANKTDNATSSPPNTDTKLDPSTDASFNFEVKLKGDIVANTQDKKETTTPTDNTSEERTTEYVKAVDAVKYNDGKSSVTNIIQTTERQTKYNTNFQTLQPSRLSAQDPTVTQRPSITPSSVGATKDISDWLRPMGGSVREQGHTAKESATAARISGNFDRKSIKDLEIGNKPVPDKRSRFTVSTSSQMETVFNSQPVRQLHESENLMLTPPRFTPTTESPITEMYRSSFSQQGKATLPPIIDRQEVLPFIDQEMSINADKFTVVSRDKISSDKVSSDTALSGKVSSNKNIGANSVDLRMQPKSIGLERVQQTVVSPPLGQSMAKKVAPRMENRVDRTTFPSHHLDRGQTEQIISLADVLNDIRKIQLHNMQRFNIHNNNFNTMLLSNTDMSPSLRSPATVGTVFNNYPRIPSNRGTGFLNQPTARPFMGTNTGGWQRHANSGRNALRDAIDAMLVLTVDDVVADHTNLHGALVLSQAREPSSGSSSSSNK